MIIYILIAIPWKQCSAYKRLFWMFVSVFSLKKTYHTENFSMLMLCKQNSVFENTGYIKWVFIKVLDPKTRKFQNPVLTEWRLVQFKTKSILARVICIRRVHTFVLQWYFYHMTKSNNIVVNWLDRIFILGLFWACLLFPVITYFPKSSISHPNVKW